VAGASESGKAAGEHRGFADRGGRRLLEPPAQPSCPRPACAHPVIERDQRRQLESLLQVELPELTRSQFGGDEVASLDRSSEPSARMSVFAQRSLSSLGPDSTGSLTFEA
jgi:hypothetical protein